MRFISVGFSGSRPRGVCCSDAAAAGTLATDLKIAPVFLYWILYPLLSAAMMFGLGLGVRRLGVKFHPALLIPIGFCAAVTIGAIVTLRSEITNFAGPTLFVLGGAGWLASWREVSAAVKGGALRRHWEWIAAGVVSFYTFGASAISAGVPTFTGYNQIVDIASQLNWTTYFADFGRDPITEVVSSSDGHIAGTMPTGYPAGPQAVLGVVPKFLGLDVTWCWQPFIAMAVGMTAMAAYAALRLATDSRGFAAVGAYVASQSSVLIGYGFIGGIKETTAVATIMTTVAVMPTVLTRDVPVWRVGIPFVVGLAGMFSVFSLTLLPWLAILSLGALILLWAERGPRDAIIIAGIALGLLVIITLPTIVPSLHSGSFAERMKTDVGNLATVMSRWTISGIWFTNDHRFDLEGTARTASIIVGSVVLVLAVVGLYVAWKRKAMALLVISAASLIGAKFIMLRFGDWMDLKALCLSSPFVLLMAVVGLSWARGSSRKPLMYAAWLGLAGLVVASVYSNALRYGSAQLAPHDRFEEMQRYDRQFAGTPKSLDPDWDENAAVQLRHMKVVQAFNYQYPPTPEWSRDPARPETAYQWNLDNIDPGFVNGFNAIVMRRAPTQSRPPGEFVQVAQGHYFTVWQRDTTPKATARLALGGAYNPADRKKCEAFVRSQPKNATITIAPGAPLAAGQYIDAQLSKAFQPAGGGAVYTMGKGGKAGGTVDVGGYSGKFDVFMTVIGNQKAKVTVDGQTIWAPRDPSAAIYPGYIGTVTLPETGAHTFTVEVDGPSLLAGTSTRANKGAWLGAPQLVPSGQLFPQVITAPRDQAKCLDTIDWVESRVPQPATPQATATTADPAAATTPAG